MVNLSVNEGSDEVKKKIANLVGRYIDIEPVLNFIPIKLREGLFVL